MSQIEVQRADLNDQETSALDANAIAALPTDSTVLSAHRHGTSAWTTTARIHTLLSNGAPKTYFFNFAPGPAGKTMLEGEFHSMRALHAVQPTFAPEPYAWGKYATPEPETYFVLCDFIDMISDELPDPVTFCAKLAALHRDSTMPSMSRGFGFDAPTCHGRIVQEVGWMSSWAAFFATMLQGVLEKDRETNPGWSEFEEVAERTVAHVVPRFLGALQGEGRVLEPCLIHGDLWEGNVGTEAGTGVIYIFDSGAYYAHHEMELGMWRCERQKIKSKVYFEEYLRHAPASEPKEEFWDRNRLYCVKMNVVHSAHHKGSIVRETAYNDMCYLIDKYAPFADGEAMPRSKVKGEVDPSIVDGFNLESWNNREVKSEQA